MSIRKRDFLKLSLLSAISLFAPKLYAQSSKNIYKITAQNKYYQKVEFEIIGIQDLKTGDRISISHKDYGDKYFSDEKKDVYEIKEIKRI